jgi:TRAP-type mannitol/chloroaromatic compound transport system substrate-binding protein
LNPDNYAAWRYDRNASEIVERFYRRFGVVGVACGVTAPHGDIWVKQPITSLYDLKDLKIRVIGMQINVFAKVGALVNTLSVGELVPAMDRGLLDAAIVFDPRSDLAYGLQNASRAYMVGQLNGARGLDLIVNAGLWDSLSPDARNATMTACRANVHKMGTESPRIASEAINEIRKTVRLYKLPDSVSAGLRSAWNEVRSEEMAKNATFAELAATMTAYESSAQRPDLSAYGLNQFLSGQ